MKLGTYGGVPPAPFGPNTLKATLADVNAGVIGAKYKWQALTLFGGYEYARLSTPTDYSKYVGNLYNFNNSWTDYPGVVQSNAFVKPEDLQVFWLGAKYGILSNLDAIAGYYHEWQNNYDTSPVTNCVAYTATVTTSGQIGKGTAKSDCAGTTNVVSGMLDWRPVKRVDVYGGVMYSVVSGGMASGYIHTDNTAYTGGVRVNF